MKGICTDNPSVENLIVNNGVYVDKTDVLLGLVRDPLASQFFLSRPRRFGKSLIACFARIPHEWKLASEAEAKRFFQLYCHFLGAKIKGEHESHLGRADAVLELPNGVYLFEFKYAKSSEEALAQIKSRGYADAYQDDSRPVWLVGCNYNPETRSLDQPAMERLRL